MLKFLTRYNFRIGSCPSGTESRFLDAGAVFKEWVPSVGWDSGCLESICLSWLPTSIVKSRLASEEIFWYTTGTCLTWIVFKNLQRIVCYQNRMRKSHEIMSDHIINYLFTTYHFFHSSVLCEIQPQECWDMGETRNLKWASNPRPPFRRLTCYSPYQPRLVLCLSFSQFFTSQRKWSGLLNTV